MCDKNSRTWISNLVLVVVVAVTVTAPLIQHVACSANDAAIAAAVETSATATAKSTVAVPVKQLPPLASLVKRDVTSVGGSGNVEDDVAQQNGGSDLDFDAYVNDFNMQDEASIPEDILDQQHIQDGDVQYATEPEATDIILEARKLNSQNFAVYNNQNKSSNTRSSNGSKLHKKNLKSEKYAKEREEFYDDMAIVKENKNKNKNKNKYQNENDNDNDNDNADHDENDDRKLVSNEDGDIVQQNRDLSSGSALFKKFETTKSIKNEKQQQQDELQYKQYEDPVKHQEHKEQQNYEQHQKQLEAIVKLNQRKFNKVSEKRLTLLTKQRIDETIKNSSMDSANKRYSEEVKNTESEEKNVDSELSSIDEDSTVATVAANENIEDYFLNGDEAFSDVVEGAQKNSHENDYGGGGGGATTGNDRDKYKDKVRDSDRNQDKSVIAPSESEQRSMDVKDAMGQLTSDVFVGKKTKRFNRVRTFNSGDRQTQQMPFELAEHYKSNDNTEKDKSEKNGRNFKEQEIYAATISTTVTATDDEAKAKLLSDFDNKNGSNVFKDTQNASGQFQQLDEYAAIKNAYTGESKTGYAAMFSEEPKQTQQKQHASIVAESEFEKHKARRRNNRRSGHKSHKKRYKDYLRFAMTPTETTAIKASLVESRPTATAKNENINNQMPLATANGTNSGEMKAAMSTPTKFAYNFEQYKQNEHVAENIKNVENVAPTQHVERLRKYVRKLKAEKSRGLPASPIFAVPNRNSVTTIAPPLSESKPFYEGQINYYMETKDDEQASFDDNTSNWYRRVGPVLRNGIKTVVDGSEPMPKHKQHLHHHNHHVHHHRHHDNNKHQQQFNQHHRLHADHLHQQHRTQHHRQQQQQHKQHQSTQSNPYQRKMLRKPTPNINVASLPFSTPKPPLALPPLPFKPHAGAMQELGHQITEMEELERYYAKWPHLARVQLQVYDEHFREQHPEIYPDYDQDYESAAELEEAQNDKSEDAFLPPYIKKYNRRNKQLLNLLEGTLPPPMNPIRNVHGHFSSLLQPGPHESNSRGSDTTPIRIDDDYMKEKRRRYHNRYGSNNHNGNSNSNNNNNNSNNDKNNNVYNGFQHDLFAQQRVVANANDNITTTATKAKQKTLTEQSIEKESSTVTQNPIAIAHVQTQTNLVEQNQLPDEDVSISQEEQNDNGNGNGNDWQEEIETKSNRKSGEITGSAQMTWQIEKLTTQPSMALLASIATAPAPATTALISQTTTTPKSALFRLPSYPAISGSYVGKPRSRSSQFVHSSRGNTFINMHRDDYHLAKTRHTHVTVTPDSTSAPIPSVTISTPNKTINSFVYHRVVDSAPRFVGAGSTGLKQRLPFVAITDRRLETAKKTLIEHKKDLEQNFYPMP